MLGKHLEKNGHFFKFVGTIRDEEFFKSRHFNMLCESGGSLSKKKRKSSAVRDNKIEDSTKLLEKGMITVETFLSRMVYDRNGICVNMVPKKDIFQEVREDSSSEEEDVVVEETQEEGNLCVVCMTEAPNTVLLPCRHLKTCDECVLKLQAKAIAEENNILKCPCCRGIVEDTMRIFT